MANLELNCRWHFDAHGGREDGPNDPMQENFKKTPYASLIRESLQNSLDVPLDDKKPVRVEYSISRIRISDYSNFFELTKHIKGCLQHFPENSDANEVYPPMIKYLSSLGHQKDLNYIKISDYNTIGMDYEKGNTTKPFYAFVRAAGVSSKSDKTAGGSFGYGKAAFFYISPIRTVFVSTKTSDGKCFFEGASSLCTHELPHEEGLFSSVGYYDNNGGEPVVDSQNIPARFQRTEPGTDIFIMGIDATEREEIYREMTEAVLRNFWLAILEGKLEVCINNIEITQESLPLLMDEYFPEVHDCTKRGKYYNPRPYFEAVNLAGVDNKHLFFDRELPIIGHVKFYAFLKKGADDKVLYMRKPKMLVFAKRTHSSNGFYGVFVCDDPTGNEYLRKIENPAHDEWKSSNWRDSGRISSLGRDARQAVDSFITNIMEEMFSSKDKGAQDIKGLNDFLYIPTAVEEDEDDFESESFIGEAIEITEVEGGSATTTLSDIAIVNNEEKPSIGKVLISNCDDKKRKKSTKGALSGHGDGTRKHPVGGGTTSGKVDSRYEEDNDGINGATLTEIPVKYRSFAQTENGKIVHTIVIHSEFDFSNGRIDLIIGGEQSDDKVVIKDCEPSAVINDNSISGLSIKTGKNVLKVTFADNMKHAVKLDAYELK